MVLKQLGYVFALNRNGGGSTTMFIENKGDKGVVNWPSDHQKNNSQGKREVANCIAIIKK